MLGIGTSLSVQLWKILFENRAVFYLSNSENNDFVNGLPAAVYRGGIYFNGMLFDGNLDLKTGFYFTYTGSQKTDLPASPESYIPPEIDPSYQVDFTLAGEIQERAVIYFTWENLLGEEYYIVPFYPMREAGIRFGLAWELFN
jgi:hypothetical protein